MASFATACATMLLLAARPVQAQAASAPPKRPALQRDAQNRDARDWRAYFECGTTATSFDRARECFRWAARLDPSRPEPPYALWWISDLKDTVAYNRALMLDPFVYHGRVLNIQFNPAGILTSAKTRAWSALGTANYYVASQAFVEHLWAHPDDIDARWGIAIALFYRQKYDSAALHLRDLEAIVETRKRERLQRIYHSTYFLNYMEAAAELAGGDRTHARASLERALVENLAFYQAHVLLAELDFDAGDTAGAEHHWADARDLFGDDPVARRRYAQFLLRSARAPDAERELRAVVAAEPYWSDAYADLARAVDAQGDSRRADAIAAYDAFLSRAPTEPAAPREQAAARLSALRGAR